jgi:hypothetical protein
MSPKPPFPSASSASIGLATFLLVCGAASACSLGGWDDEPGAGHRNGPNGGSTTTQNTPGHIDPAVACNGTPAPGAAPLRRLTQSQYNNVVRDLLGDTTHPADAFPPDETVGVFSNNAASQTVPALLAQAYFTASEALAQKALTNKNAILPCNPASGEDACARQFVQTFGKKAYRRPLTTAEIDDLVAVYTDNKTGGTFDDGLEAVIETILNSATFLYVEEYGDVSQSKAGVVPLTGYEMASRLSFFLWNSIPDDALYAAAEKGELATKEQIIAQARRMIADPKAHDATSEFFDQWLELKRVTSLSKDSATYPGFDDATRASLLGEVRAFTSWVTFSSDGRLPTLLTAPVTFLDSTSATFYGEPFAGTGLQKVDLDATKRGGILTQGAILATLSKPNQSSPVLRGKFVRERFLCQILPPPPPGLNIVPPEVKPGATTRERYAEHDKNQACAGCHRMMDPIGFGFEHYDGSGKYRDMDQGLPIDTKSDLTDTDVDGAFNGAVELGQRLSQSQQVRDCVATQYYRYALARAETDVDKCSLGITEKAFADGKADFRELIVGIASTDTFRYRPEVKP